MHSSCCNVGLNSGKGTDAANDQKPGYADRGDQWNVIGWTLLWRWRTMTINSVLDSLHPILSPNILILG